MNRRSFLGSLAGTGLGALGLAACASAGAAGTGQARRDRVGVQLYTVRDQLERDFPGTLERVARIGYKELEFAGYYGQTPEQVRQLLDRLDLSAPSAHIGIELLRKDLNGQLRAARTIGHRYVTIPYLVENQRPKEVAGWQRLAAEINRYATVGREQGLRFAYHNHDFEFAALPGGRTGLDVLLAETNPALVDFELDLYWAAFAGRDPLRLFAQHPGRFTMWHVKDMTAARQMVPVGQGQINFRDIFARAQQAGLRHFFVEHDNAAQTVGSLASIQTSYQHLQQLLS